MIARIHKVRKKLGAFYKVSLSIILIASIILFYFVVLVASGPRSINFVTNKINEKVISEFGRESSINNSEISFTSYGSFRVAIIGLNISYSNNAEDKKEFYTIPRIEAEFSILNFLLLNFQPTKIKVIKPLIVINDVGHFKSPQQEALKEEGQLSAIISILSAIREGENPIENFEIEDAKIVVFNSNLRTDILLKNSKIQASKQGDILTIFSQNKIGFDPEKSDVNLDSNCKFSAQIGLNCDLFLNNFSPDSISNLHPSLKDLGKISATFNSNISFGVKNGELGIVTFKTTSDFGSFDFAEFFSQKITFKDLTISGKYDNKLKILNVSSIESDFAESLNSEDVKADNPHISMSAVFDIFNNDPKNSQIYIKLQNILTNDLEKFWPVSLDQESIRSWVLEHIKDGVIKDAYAKISLTHAAETTLEKIDAQLTLSGVNLNYDSEFPSISNISAIANFSENDMKIVVSSGDVLDSKISEGLVQIKDFSKDDIILDISAKVVGNAADGLKHASNDPEFLNEIQKYLNGEATSKVDVSLNLTQEISLENTYISSITTIKNLNNEYARGDLSAEAKKKFGSNDFVNSVDLTSVEILPKGSAIEKKLGVKSALNFTLKVDSDRDLVQIKNLSLTAKEDKAKVAAEITANFDINTLSGTLEKLRLQNKNFGKNDFSISFDEDKKSKISELNIKGLKFDLGSLVANKFFDNFSKSDNSSALKVRINLPTVYLLNGKILKQFSLALNYGDGIFNYGLMKANYFGKNFIDLKINKNKKEDFSEIAGEISNLGYLADAFGISNVVSGGNAEIKIKNTAIKNAAVFVGEIEVDEDITIYETETVKRLAKNDLFSRIEDKIFSSEKTIFDFVKIKFEFADNILNLKSLIANNYKIGVTAKGSFDVKNSTYQLKGMIIPGFLINNLFGIGNIPIIGGVISGILTGGEGGGVFGIRYEYVKTKNDTEGQFSTNAITSFVPSTIQNLFDF